MSQRLNHPDMPVVLFALRHLPSGRYFRTGYPREKSVPSLYNSLSIAKKMAGNFATKLAWQSTKDRFQRPAAKQKFLNEIVIEEYKLTLGFTITR